MKIDNIAAIAARGRRHVRRGQRDIRRTRLPRDASRRCARHSRRRAIRRERRSARPRAAHASGAKQRPRPVGRSVMTEAEFRALAAQGYNRIPLVLESFADLDTPLSLYLKLAQPALHVPARIGRRRRALRPLLVHRPAGEGARCACSGHRTSRSRTPAASSSGTTAIRSRSSREFLRPLSRCAAAGAAALLRRPRRLLRLRHRAPHRAAGWPDTSGRPRPARRPARHAAAADRGARRHRQPRRARST